MSPSLTLLLRIIRSHRARYIAAWLLALGIAAGRLTNAHLAFHDWRSSTDPNHRVDGNYGHLSIDFGGQWLMGRILASGRGRELYSRPCQWATAEKAYPRECEARSATKHDPELLIQNFMGRDDPHWGDFAGSVAALASSADALQCAATALASHDEWSEQRLEELERPHGPDGIGGALYPPINAFVWLPFAGGDHPQSAYFAMQYVQTLLCFVAGLGASLLARGRFWWPLASALILLYPGSRGVIDLGQNSALSLSLLVWGWLWLSRGAPIAGGIAWGCLAYKPVWAVSFLLLLLLMRQWRMALAMCLTGLLLILATLPFVGWQTWLNWLTVIKEASNLYNVDANWVPLSRDVLNIPRRFLIDFNLDTSQRENPLALLASWACWLFIVELTLRVYCLRRARPVPLIGPLPALLIFATWMCTFHFMYYDALLSAFGVCVLLADPRPFFRPQILNRSKEISTVFGGIEGPGHGRRSSWFVNSFVLSVVTILLLHENISQPLKLQATIVIDSNTSKRKLNDDTTELAPRFVVGTGDHYPLDTLLIAVLWAWCCVRVLGNGEGDSTQQNVLRALASGSLSRRASEGAT